MKICWGTTRVVALVGSIAFKIPAITEWRLFLLGLLANLQEAKFYRLSHWPELCPVLWSAPGGFLIVMRRARPLTREEFDSIDFVQWVKREHYTIPAEPKLDSFGWVDDRLVAVDYGN